MSKTRKRKNPYVSGIAQLNFKPDYDWEIEEAAKLFKETTSSFRNIDNILFEDCIAGMKKLPAEIIDLIIADPPFGINFSGKEAIYNRNEEFVVEQYEEIVDNYGDFSDKWISELPRLMKDTSSAYIFSGWTNLKDILTAIEKSGLELINHIIWKYQFGVFTKRKFVTSHYHILFVVKDPKKYFFNKIEHYPLDIWDIPRTYKPGVEKNGTKLPEAVVERAINFSSKPGDLIFDPFMGNGTTAVCAKATYRHYIGFEKNTNLASLLEENISSVQLGEHYKPYRTFLPSIEELAEKYPAVRGRVNKDSELAEKDGIINNKIYKTKKN